MRYVDTHCHIIPNVDDGSKSFEESIEMCKIAASEGIRRIVATPHFIQGDYMVTAKEVKNIISELQTELWEREIPIELYNGHEVLIDPQIVKLVENNTISTLNNSRYILVELPMNEIPSYTEDVLHSLILKGFIPVIAHPERNSNIIEDPRILSRFLRLGALSQMTTWSILGRYGEKVRVTAEVLLEHNMVHLLATDAHSPRRRSPKFSKAIPKLVEIVGSERAQMILENAERIIDNKELYTLPVKRIKEKKSFLSLVKTMFN